METSSAWIGFIILVCIRPVASLNQTDDSRLKADLRQKAADHGILTRPVLYPEQELVVRFGLRLIRVDIDEPRNVMVVDAWVRQAWNDSILPWKKSEYGGINRAVLHPDWIWTPQISLANTAKTTLDEETTETVVRDDGKVFWLAHKTYESACHIDLTYFPFDTHTCDMWFQSMVYKSKKLALDIYLPGIDFETHLSGFRESDEWEILSNTSSVIRRSKDAGEPLVFSRRRSIRLRLVLSRRPGFTSYMLTVPCVILSAMTSLVFIFPPQRPDRHVVAASILSSTFILLLIVVEVAPPSPASAPILLVYYAVNISLLMLALILSAIVVNLLRKCDDKTPFPRKYTKVLRTLCNIFRVHVHVIFNLLKREDEMRPIIKVKTTCDQKIEAELKGPSRCDFDDDAMRRDPAVVMDSWNQNSHICWRLLASVLDRFFFFQQIILVVIAAVCLYPSQSIHVY